jgi:hypothetical protein
MPSPGDPAGKCLRGLQFPGVPGGSPVRYRSRRPCQESLRARLKEMALMRVCDGHRELPAPVRLEG